MNQQQNPSMTFFNVIYPRQDRSGSNNPNIVYFSKTGDLSHGISVYAKVQIMAGLLQCILVHIIAHVVCGWF